MMSSVYIDISQHPSFRSMAGYMHVGHLPCSISYRVEYSALLDVMKWYSVYIGYYILHI